MSNQTIHELTNLSEISTNDELPIWDNSAGATKKVSVEELSLAVNNTVNSYSTTEHATGKKWIDGKPIYRKCFECHTSNTILSNSVGGARYSFTDTTEVAQIIDTLITSSILKNERFTFTINASISSSTPIDIVLYNYSTSNLVTEVNKSILILEYTKTTD